MELIRTAGLDLVVPVEIVGGVAGLALGDCLEVLRMLPDNSVDSIVTDPPYGLSFMGKRWDYDVPGVDVWAECLRVLKPGGHLLAFAGTRTQHRMAVRIEDAGFQIIDMLAWVHGQGFPKSMNLDRFMGEKFCGCHRHALQYSHENVSHEDLRGMSNELAADEPLPAREEQDVLAGVQREAHKRREDRQEPKSAGRQSGDDGDVPCVLAGVHAPECLDSQGGNASVQPAVQRKAAGAGAGGPRLQVGRAEGSEPETTGAEQPCVEGRGDASQTPGQLCSGSVCASTEGRGAHGAQGRLCDGAPLGNGEVDRQDAAADGGCAPRGPRAAEQRADEPGTVAGQSEPQAVGAWPVCGGCGLPRVPSGLGTALKPALEPITVARKPLIGTVAANVLAHGTGALNVDGCRVAGWKPQVTQGINSNASSYNVAKERRISGGSNEGRWPANLIHDGSDDVAEVFGDPARFFYCAKASKADRNAGCGTIEAKQYSHDGRETPIDNAYQRNSSSNSHPTVKPTDLMRYLCRLVTPPGGVVLDPFMGSGSTGKAAMLEGFRFVGCELSPEYMAIAAARIAHAVAEDLAG